MPEIKPSSSTKVNQSPIDGAALLAWYDKNARKLPWRVGPSDRAKGVTPNPYFVWLSEIMLQQTTVPTVGKYFADFTTRWPTVFDLATAERDDVLKAWAGLGYYARARNLHACANQVVGEYGGIFPNNADDLQKLPGIGPYTSAAIAAICFDEQVAVIDGNVDRVAARFTALAEPVREAKPFIRSFIQQSVPARAGDFAQSLMDLGATICAPKRANCLICPIAAGCTGTLTAEPTNFPVMPPKKQKPLRVGHAFVVENAAEEIWLRQRPEKGLLAAMTEVPGSEWFKAEKIDAKPEVEFPLNGEWQNCGTIDHVFTHFALNVSVWKLNAETPPSNDGWWAKKLGLNGEALPTIFKKVLAAALERE
ncbi:A/G-specific adenine glycosylase [Maritalea sp.]|uniref:A/G-specific adenine glycosylase n=1 Tax=Maritalea sp. TaxID=2003361 RepID=UPI003EF97ADA